MAADMEKFIQLLIAVGFLPVCKGPDGMWRRRLVSVRFTALMGMFLAVYTYYLYIICNRFQVARPTLSAYTGLALQVLMYIH